VRVIVGLGNPGSEYLHTRHNLGFAVVDAIAEKTRTVLKHGKGEYLSGSTIVGGESVLLIKPTTYMNNSGIAVQDVLERYDVLIRDLLVIVDDFNLPLGTIRIREHGSDGGHNGLYSIIYQLNSDDIPRLRCGIASDKMSVEKSRMAEFVLARFEKDEQRVTEQLILDARDAALMAARGDIRNAMSLYNKKKIN
jgi:PTH1 family peptidyl-tRNA hydrolase